MTQIVGWDNYGSSEVGADQLRDQNGNQVDASTLPQNFAGTVPTNVAIGATVQLELKPLRVIRPDRIMVGRVPAQAFNMSDITIGTTSLNASRGSIALDAFAPDAVNATMRCTVTASPNLSIYFTVTNISGAIVNNFCIGIIGPSIQA